jgi:hypothetical protein
MSRNLGEQTTMSEREEFHSMVYALLDFSEHNEIDNAIPAFATAVAMLGVKRGADKKMYLSYLAGVIDRVYSEFETKRGKGGRK